MSNHPPAPGQHRNLIILLDGTSNQFSSANTNVIKLMSVLDADEDQLLYYSSGVGTLSDVEPGVLDRLRKKAAEWTDLAVAWNFDTFVCDAYKFLMDYHRTGDHVYIFGFSRGAYTARVLAGMVEKVGLLPAGNHNQIKLAYEVYTSPETVQKRGNMRADLAGSLSTQYRRIFGISRPVDIHFIGVWDTVSSIGGLDLPRLPLATGVRTVKFFRQALALDERRAKFAPEYRHLDKDEKPVDHHTACHDADHLTESVQKIDPKSAKTAESLLLQAKKIVADSKDVPTVAVVADNTGKALSVKCIRKNVECWFMGCHSDVGGSNDENWADSLSNIPFRWMLREAVQCGIRLDASGIALQPAIAKVKPVVDAGLIPERLSLLLKDQYEGNSHETTHAEEVRAIISAQLPPAQLAQIVETAAAYDTEVKGDKGEPITKDLQRPIKESLTLAWFPLEVFVLETRHYGVGQNEAKDVWKMNLGQGRQMAEGQSVHRSVQKRLLYDKPLRSASHTGEKYEGPRAKLPQAWKTNWEELRLGKGPDVWED